MVIPRGELARLKIPHLTDPDPLQIALVVHFDRQIDFSQTALGKRTDHLELRVDPPAVLFLRRYLSRAREATNGGSRETPPGMVAPASGAERK